ncbi:MAG: endonuclease/exonuclease/phosphatase family protein [Taibaiella sp.]|nr:endonuclease/exonuclease/phosphatase family protein [Taibaiella sp.]
MNDGDNKWANRKTVLISLIRFYDFDILGTQEGLTNQLNDINEELDYYNRYGVGRDDGIDAGEHSSIFFKKDKFTLTAKGDFWLSETPDKPSLGWDATCCNRLCTWVRLLDQQSGNSLFVFNVHYDHEGTVARDESSKLILKKISTIAGNDRVILTGDFNAGHQDQCYLTLAKSSLLKDTYEKTANPFAFNPSFNDFGKNLKSTEIIDHVFVSEQIKVTKWGMLTDSYQGKYPSDHFPIMVEIQY